MTGLRKKRARKKALNKFQNSTDELLNYEGRELFYTGFNMGWRKGKKRQLQIFNRSNNFEPYKLISNTSPISIMLELQNHIMDVFNPIYSQQKKIATAEMELEKVSNCGSEEKEISLGCEEPAPSSVDINSQQPSEKPTYRERMDSTEDIVFSNKNKCFGFKSRGRNFKKSSADTLNSEKDIECNNCGGNMKYHKNESILIPVGSQNSEKEASKK